MIGTSVEIKPVTTRKELKRFIKIPWRIYAGNANWVPPLISVQLDHLNPRKHPFFQHSQAKLFLAYKNNEPVGRIAAILNTMHNKAWNEKTGFFGFFESVEDYSVAERLFDTVKKWVAKKGMNNLRGPTNFTTNDECGFLLEGFDKPPVIMMPYTRKYYLDFAEKYGFKKAKDYYAYYIDDKIMDVSRYESIADAVKKRFGFEIRPLNIKKYWQEAEIIENMINDIWRENWGTVPMTKAELHHLAKKLKLLAQPQLVLIAEKQSNNEPIGFSISLPDINRILIKLNGRLFPFGIFKLIFGIKKIDSLRTLTLGVKKEYRNKGIEGVFLIEILRRTTSVGYHVGEMSWTLEDNQLINKAMERVGGILYKKYRLYNLPI